MKYPMHKKNGHIIMTVNGADWLIDTGAPVSFGDSTLLLVDSEFPVVRNYLGLNAESLSQSVGVKLEGLIGADVLNGFYLLFDLPGKEIVFSKESLALIGDTIEMDEFMGIPIIPLELNGEATKAFFDTGAQVSYCPQSQIERFPFIEVFKDFYPGLGEFETFLHLVDFTIGKTSYSLRCGVLPQALEAVLMFSDTECIIGNEIMDNRIIGYFPLSKEIIVGNFPA